jgi:hypothetical protein
LEGNPVLAGRRRNIQSADVVDYIPDPYFGITLPKDVNLGSNIGCTNSDSDYMNRHPVFFGANSQGGCTLWLTRDDFKDQSACASLRSRIFDLQTFTASQIDVVGKFGNASAANIFDWIPVINSGGGALDPRNGQTVERN